MKLLSLKYCFFSPIAIGVLFFTFCFSISSCKKDSFVTSAGALLSTDVDSLKFDTVSTSIGSTTQSFKIRNGNDQKLLLSSVKVMGGTSSPYKININGIPAQEANNIELAA